MGPRKFYVHILANKIGGTLYIGVTSRGRASPEIGEKLHEEV